MSSLIDEQDSPVFLSNFSNSHLLIDLKILSIFLHYEML